MVANERQELTAVFLVNDYESFLKDLYHHSKQLNASFQNSRTELSEGEMIEQFRKYNCCSLTWNYQLNFNIEIHQWTSDKIFLNFFGFNKHCLKNNFLGQQNYIYLLQYDLFIPLLLNLTASFVLIGIDVSAKYQVLRNILDEESQISINDSKSIIALISYATRFRRFKENLAMNLQNHGYKSFQDEEGKISLNLPQLMPDFKEKWLSGVCGWFYIHVQGYNIKFIINSSILLLRPLEPYKTILIDSQKILDVRFYTEAFVNITAGTAISEITLDDIHIMT